METMPLNMNMNDKNINLVSTHTGGFSNNNIN